VSAAATASSRPHACPAAHSAAKEAGPSSFRVSAIATVLAFGALSYLEHLR
jgi:hypothetical protein